MDPSYKIEMVINRCHGGFGLSPQASYELAARKGKKLVKDKFGFLLVEGTHNTIDDIVPRHDPDLVAIVKKLGKKASGDCADLRVVTVSVDIEIEDRDGYESVHVSGGEY